MNKTTTLIEPCFQCDLDIAHVCHHGNPDARWGLHDGAVEAFEAAARYLAPKAPPKTTRRRVRR